MYVRVMSREVVEGKMDELLAAVEKDVEPILHHMEGFRGGFVFTDRESNKPMSIAVWETEDDLLASEGAPIYVGRISRMAAVLREPPTPQHFEASVCQWFGPPGKRANPLGTR